MALPLSGYKDLDLIRIETADLVLLLKGRPIHPSVTRLQLHQDAAGEWSKAKLNIISFEGSYSAKVFDPFKDEIQESVDFHPGTGIFPCFYEQQTYSLQVESKSGRPLEFFHQNKYLREAVSEFRPGIITGNLNFRNEIGYSDLQVNSNGRPLLKITIEVFPSKIDYRTDFQNLLREVNEEIYNMAYDMLMRTYFPATPVAVDKPSLNEFFGIVNRIFEKLVLSLERVKTNPHHQILRYSQVSPLEKVKRFDHHSRKWLTRHPEVLRPIEQSGIQLDGRGYLPQKIIESKKVLSYDTAENRFIKWVLRKIDGRLKHFGQEYLKLYWQDSSRFDKRVVERLEHMSNNLRRFNQAEFLAEVQELTQLESLSLVLQMAPGYREVYKYYLMLSKGLSIQSDVMQMSVKDLATLYEYWCFLSLNKMLKKYKLVNNSLIKVNNNGLTITLRKDKGAQLNYVNGNNGEKLTLAYQEQVKTPTTAQIPDTVLTLNKEGSDIKYKYVFDAKYRINPALDKRYFENHGKPGPEEDDINTMHRYRDAVVYANKDHNYERTVYGAFVLFPYANEEDYSGKSDGKPHTFFRSLDQINIGGLPFLPGHTSLVQEFLDELVMDSPDTAMEKALVHEATEDYYLNKYIRKNVYVGSLRNTQQWEINREYCFYHTPLRNVIGYLNNIEYIAIYQSKNLFGSEGGVRYFGRINSYKILPRGKITEIKSKNNGTYVRFEIDGWQELPRRILPLGYGVTHGLVTTLPLLLEARELPELLLPDDFAIRLWRELRRATGGYKVVPSKNQLDDAQVDNIKLFNGKISIEGDKLVVYGSKHKETWEIQYLKNNSVKGYKEVKRFLEGE